MADESALLKILVQLGVIGQEDVRAAKALLEETGEAGKDALKDMNTAMPENLAAWKNYSNTLKTTGAEADNLREGLHGLTGAARLGGLSEFAHLAHAALNPVAITVGALALGLETYFKWLEKTQEKQEELNESLQIHNNYVRELIKLKGDVNELEVEHAKAVAAAEVAANGLSAQLERADRLSRSFAETEKLQQTDAEANARRHNSILEDRIKLLETLGMISAQQAETAKL